MTENTKKEIRIKFRKEFAAGKQNRHIDSEGNIVDDELHYYWEQRPIYNITGCLVGYAQRYLNKGMKESNDESSDNLDEIIYGDNGLVDRLIPCQRSYNALKGRYAECVESLFFGEIIAEDGSVDVDELCEEGISPGKVIIYRQGSIAPRIIYKDPKTLTIINKQCNMVYNEMLEIVRLFIMDYRNVDIILNLSNLKR